MKTQVWLAVNSHELEDIKGQVVELSPGVGVTVTFKMPDDIYLHVSPGETLQVVLEPEALNNPRYPGLRRIEQLQGKDAKK